MRNAWILGLLTLGACDVGDAVTAVTAGVVGTTIDATKGVAEGFKTGVQEGRKDSRSLDGSTVLSTPEEITASTDLWALEARESPDGVEVVLAVENLTETPLHLIGLTNDGGAVLLDAQGFATPLARPAAAVEVPPQARVKTSLFFSGDIAAADAVRVWGQELDIP